MSQVQKLEQSLVRDHYKPLAITRRANLCDEVPLNVLLAPHIFPRPDLNTNPVSNATHIVRRLGGGLQIWSP